MRADRLEEHTDMTVAQLQERAKSGDARSRKELLEVYGLFASEYDYRPVNPASIPYGEFAVGFARRQANRVLLNHGAIQCLEKLLPCLADGGFILTNDYGQTQVSRDDEFEHQRFSLTTAVGLLLPLVKAYFADGNKCQWLEATAENRGIHTRLLGNKIDPDVAAKFYEAFGDANHQRLQEPIQAARACLKAGRFEMAASFYQKALKLQPANWQVHEG